MTARQILDARLASGEIDLATYQQIRSALDQENSSLSVTNSREGAMPLSPPPRPIEAAEPIRDPKSRQVQGPTSGSVTPPVVSWLHNNWKYLAFGFAVFAVAGFIRGHSGLTVANLRQEGTSHKFTLVNESSSTGDVLLHISQNNLDFCYRVTTVEANSRYDITISCPQVSEGRYTLQYEWAKNNPSLANAAERF